jgi:hypothetical protein
MKINSREFRNGILQIERMSIADVDDSYVFSVLSKLMKGYTTQTTRILPGSKIHRARKCEKPRLMSEISYPPAHLVTSYGRGNLIGQSVFYGSTSGASALAELDCKIGDRVILSEWEVLSELELNHIGFTEETMETLNATRELDKIYSFVKSTQNYSELNSMVHEYLGFIFSKPTQIGKEQDQYKLSANLTQIMMYNTNFDGLLYPTIKLFGSCDNVLLKTKSVDEKIKAKSVSYILITAINNDEYSFNYIDTAPIYSMNGLIPW